MAKKAAKQTANDAFLLEDVALYFTKVNNDSPVEISRDGKTGWETQIRTTDKEVAKYWRSMALNVTAVREDPDDEDSAVSFYKCTIRKKEYNAKGVRTQAPAVVAGDLSDIDVTTIGNGSIGDIRVFQYDYSFKSADGMLNEGVGSVLMAIQITELNEYVPNKVSNPFTRKDFVRHSVADQQGAPVDDVAPASSDIDDEIPF